MPQSGCSTLSKHPLALQLTGTDPLRHAFVALLGELASPQLGTRALTEALLKQCLILLVRRVAPDPAQALWLFGMVGRSACTSRPDNGRETHSQIITLDQLAESAGMSRSAFSSHFVAAFQMTPIDLLKRIRLRHASCLLESTELPISIISKSIGYDSRTYFSRAFRAEFGTDPRTYRR